MATEREVSQAEFRDIEGGPGVVKAMYDDQPNDVADRFIAFLERNGFQVETIYNNDIPTTLYRITKDGE